MIYTLLDDVYKDLVTVEVNNYKFLHNGHQKPNWPQINWLKLHNMDFELIFFLKLRTLQALENKVQKISPSCVWKPN